ncbi:unnamed protein product [Prunus brigantina]
MLLQKKLGVEKKPNVGYFRIFGCLAYAHLKMKEKPRMLR